jgi:hypothetical protein
MPRHAAFSLFFLSLFSASCVLSVATFAGLPLQAPGEQVAPIRATTFLVLVDLLAEDKKTGEPIKDLKQDDFFLRDNGNPASILAFNRGIDHNLRPVQLWFVLACNEERRYVGGGQAPGAGGRRGQIAGSGKPIDMTEKYGASFLVGKAAELRLAFEHLSAEESVGVAHWCDNGESVIDLMPSRERSTTFNALEEVAARKTVVIDHMPSQDAKTQVMRLINNVALTAFPQPFLALVFLGGTGSGNGAGNSGGNWSGFMETSATDLGIEGGKSSSDATAKSQYAVKSNDYVNRLAIFIDTLHSRYEIGFPPDSRNKKQHHVSIELLKSARERYPNAVLRYREVYSAVPPAEEQEAVKHALDWHLLDSRLQAAVRSPTNQDAVVFQVQRTHAAAGHAEQFVLKAQPGELTWKTLPNGDRRSVVMAVVASYSAKGEPIGLVVKELEIMQQFDRLPALEGKPVVFMVNAPVADGAARIRLVVRDVATGHIGTQDL